MPNPSELERLEQEESLRDTLDGLAPPVRMLSLLIVSETDGRELLAVYPDGRVEGEIEDASEAAAVFVKDLRVGAASYRQLEKRVQDMGFDDLAKAVAYLEALQAPQEAKDELVLDQPATKEDRLRALAVQIAELQEKEDAAYSLWSDTQQERLKLERELLAGARRG